MLVHNDFELLTEHEATQLVAQLLHLFRIRCCTEPFRQLEKVRVLKKKPTLVAAKG